MTDFVSMPKIARLSRLCTITEKIDGTNASIYIKEDVHGTVFLTGSRTRWITPDDDNSGFSRWAHEHKADLLRLGEGHHFGEWWGAGIQRKYGLQEKRFSLFNTHLWIYPSARPACCSVVPVLYEGPFTTGEVELALFCLQKFGSIAAPGFMQPEGIVIYHQAAKMYFKKTILGDEKPKGSKEE